MAGGVLPFPRIPLKELGGGHRSILPGAGGPGTQELESAGSIAGSARNLRAVARATAD
jgi:hypothetical protein